MNRFAGLLLTFAGLLVAASPTFGQAPIETIKNMKGKLNQASKKIEFKFEKGKIYTISLDSANTKTFDPYLVVTDANNNLIGANDDVNLRAKNLNSRLVFKVPETGTYNIMVTSFKAFRSKGQAIETGSYTLEIQQGVPKEAQAELAKAQIEWAVHDALFSTKNLKAALAKAKKTKKMVMIDFTATWCGPCHALTQRTFTQKNIQKFLNEKAVCVKIDVDFQPKIARKFNVKAMPTLLFLDSTGNELGRIVGYKGPEDFIPAFKEAMKPMVDF
ncbi:MAG: DVUA0089 family protein [Gemmataceae bacterium]